MFVAGCCSDVTISISTIDVIGYWMADVRSVVLFFILLLLLLFAHTLVTSRFLETRCETVASRLLFSISYQIQIYEYENVRPITLADRDSINYYVNISCVLACKPPTRSVVINFICSDSIQIGSSFSPPMPAMYKLQNKHQKLWHANFIASLNATSNCISVNRFG